VNGYLKTDLDVEAVVGETVGEFAPWMVRTLIRFQEQAGMLWTIRFGYW
jgi:hypothetical protein